MMAHCFGSRLELWQIIVDTVAARIQADRESLATASRLGNTDYDLPRLRDAFCQRVLRQVGAGG